MTKNGAAKISGSRAVDREAEQEPDEHLRAVQRPQRRTRRASRGPAAGPAPASAGLAGRPRPTGARPRPSDPRRSAIAHGDERDVHRHEVGEVPGAADGRRPPPDGAGGEHDRRQRRARTSRSRSPPSIHQARPTPRAPRPIAIASWSVASPHTATNGSSSDRRQRRERQQDAPVRRPVRGASAGRRPGGTSSPAGRRAVGHRVREPGAAVEEGVGLPDEVVVEVVVVGVRDPVQGERGQHEQQPDERASSGCGRQERRRGSRRAPRLYSAAPSTLRRRLPVTGSGFGCARPGVDDGRRPPGEASAGRSRPIMAIGLIFRLILAYGIDGLRGSGFGADLGPVPVLGRRPSRSTARGASTPTPPTPTTRRATCTRCGPSGPCGGRRRRRRGRGHHRQLIKLPAILTDVVLGYLVYLDGAGPGRLRRRARSPPPSSSSTRSPGSTR